jgi:P63C domain
MKDGSSNHASDGGKARAAKLSPEERKKIAIAAAEKRWGRVLPVAQYAGVLKVADLEFPCAVLSDGTRVLTETSFMKVMEMYRSGALSVRREEAGGRGARQPLYLAFKNLKPFIDKHLGDEHAQPLLFRTSSGNVARGIPAQIIPKICEVWLDARNAGILGRRQQLVAVKADILIRGLAHVGITALVDEATGFQANRARDALAKILQEFVQKELRKWVRTFPVQFYQELYRLRDLAFPPESMKMPSYFGHLTNNIVYDRLAPGIKEELKRVTPRDSKGKHRHKLFQRLTDDVGHPRLREHLASVIALMKISANYEEFEAHMEKALPRWDDNLLLQFD